MSRSQNPYYNLSPGLHVTFLSSCRAGGIHRTAYGRWSSPTTAMMSTNKFFPKLAGFDFFVDEQLPNPTQMLEFPVNFEERHFLTLDSRNSQHHNLHQKSILQSMKHVDHKLQLPLLHVGALPPSSFSSCSSFDRNSSSKAGTFLSPIFTTPENVEVPYMDLQVDSVRLHSVNFMPPSFEAYILFQTMFNVALVMHKISPLGSFR